MTGRGPRWVTDLVVPLALLALFVAAMSAAAHLGGMS